MTTAAQRRALQEAQVQASAAYAALAEAQAVVAQRQAEYGEAIAALNRAVEDVVYGPRP